MTRIVWFRQDLRLVDVPLFGDDRDHSDVSAAEDLFQQVRCFDINMLLGCPEFWIGVELEGADA